MLYSQFQITRLGELFAEQWGDLRLPDLLSVLAYTHPRSVLEIGSYRGVSTEVFLLHCQEVMCIDPWPDDGIHREFLMRAGCYPNLTFIKGKSPDDLELLVTDYKDHFDMVYIDGDHSAEAVIKDIDIATKFVRSGGYIAGHDYAGPATPGVKEVVDATFKNVKTFSDMSWATRYFK